MPVVTPVLVLIILIAGTLAGMLGSTLGIGGGIFLVPFLTLGMGMPIGVAAAISLTTVIGTSSAVSAGRSGSHLINYRLGMVLEVATAAGSLLGGITAQYMNQHLLEQIFAVVTVGVGLTTLAQINRRNIVAGDSFDCGPLGGRYVEQESGGVVSYRVTRVPLALFASFVAGNVSSMLGIGGGVIKVPVLNAWCGVPLRAAAATSAFMIGVTAAAGAIIYFGNGQLVPALAAAAVLGVQAGSSAGMHFAARASTRSLKALLAVVLFAVSASMFYRSVQ
ncbi:MAG TPA: sulfite exporter TauE/SafE family protein [Vicinamibacterales bacterium]|nr:sulfite exporter TauE/SafE family protein [Vicinamibacterales bacterium]